MSERTKLYLSNVFVAIIVAILTTAIFFAFLQNPYVENNQPGDYTRPPMTSGSPGPPNSIEFLSHFLIPNQLDMRGYELCHFEVSGWFLERINYHRENFGVHGYTFYAPALVTSIEHSLDMRDNNFTANAASDGRTHQQRHDRWFGAGRTRVTSSSVRARNVDGPITREQVNVIVDGIATDQHAEAFLLNPTYYYIGIGFSITAAGRGMLSITMSTGEGQRTAHHARTVEQREQHRLAYLARVREQRGWVAPTN